MEGKTVSHYRVLERLGGGGMGVVFKAVDTKLDRLVALKFIPPDLTRDDVARLRLIQEAKTTSALDHANICTVHDIDHTADGQLFIAMSFYDGETLKKHIARRALGVSQALDIAIQIAHGLAKAHDANVIHRDIKPANVMITRDGVVKIVDFGIAKIAGQTGLTQTGLALGTIAYMSPEQINAEPIDGQTDVWSLGATLYEMLSGRPPFEGDHPLIVMKQIVHDDPAPLASVAPGLPEDVVAVVHRALQKSRSDRFSSIIDFALALEHCKNTLTAPAMASSSLRSFMRPKFVAAAVVLLAAIGAAAGWSLNRSSKLRWAREEALPEITRLMEQDRYTAAFALAEQVEPYIPDDPALRDLWPRISRTIAIVTDPPGARVYTKDYGDVSAQWRDLGVSPLKDVRVPIGLRRWRFTRDGIDAREIAQPSGANVDVSLAGTSDAGMVPVRGGDIRSWITGIDPIESVSVPNFSIDKHEVTNRQFKAFVEAGGYRKREYWDQTFVDGDKPITWDAAVAQFVDATGRPGPSTWEIGDYPSGHDEYPVSGVSWYEAAAFAKYAGKTLPTVTHWIRAAGTDFAADIAPLSNLQGAGPAAVGAYAGMGPFGTYDMAGNVREWCWNAWGSSRYVLGAAWTDPQYMFTYANLQSPFDRSATNGIRLVKYAGDIPKAATAPLEFLVRDYTKEKPVSGDVFNIYRNQFSYDPIALNAQVDPQPNSSKDYRLEKVTVDAAYGKSKLVAYVFLPASGTPPYQAVVHFPGSSAISVAALSNVNLPELGAFILKSGRALIVPVYRGTFERREGLSSTWPDQSHRYRDLVISWVQDVKRTLDYLQTRDDIDSSRLGYFGLSWGGRMGAIILAVEPRFKASMILAGGLASGRALPEVDQVNYITRVVQPVLMLNGRFDAIEPVDTAQKPMFEMLGTPKDDKKWVVYDDGHALPTRRNEVARETLEWFDRYLGPVGETDRRR